MKIENVMVRSYNGEVATMAQSILLSSKKHDWTSDEFLTDTLQAIDEGEAKLSLAIHQQKAESVLQEKDLKREIPLRALFNLVSGYLYYPDETIKDAAETIHSITNNYGLTFITQQNYAQESALYESLLKDLATEEAVDALTKLPGVGDTITKIRTEQNDFANTFVNFSEQKALDAQKDNATNLKGEVIKLINEKLLVYLRAMAMVKTDVYGDFAEATAQFIADNNDKVRKRTNRKDNDID